MLSIEFDSLASEWFLSVVNNHLLRKIVNQEIPDEQSVQYWLLIELRTMWNCRKHKRAIELSQTKIRLIYKTRTRDKS